MAVVFHRVPPSLAWVPASYPSHLPQVLIPLSWHRTAARDIFLKHTSVSLDNDPFWLEGALKILQELVAFELNSEFFMLYPYLLFHPSSSASISPLQQIKKLNIQLRRHTESISALWTCTVFSSFGGLAHTTPDTCHILLQPAYRFLTT